MKNSIVTQRRNPGIVLFILMIVCVNRALACTWTTTGASTNWTNPAAWTSSGTGCTGSYPSTTSIATGDVIVINHNMNLSTSTFQVKSGGTLTINSPASLTVTGNVDLQNGSTFTLNQGATMSVSGNFNNSNNSTGVVVNGSVSVGGNLTSGNGSTVTSPTGTGSFTVQGSISGAGTVFGSSADCTDTSVPCITNAASPLPVELLGINVECINGQVKISWETATEHNSAYFLIERSRDGLKFESLSTVSAAGTSSSIISYSYTDDFGQAGPFYYRVVQYDQDGAAVTFPLLYSDCGDKEFKVFPNPSKEDLFIHYNAQKGTVINLQIIGMNGQVYLSEEIPVKGGVNLIPVNEVSIEKGIYFVQLVQDESTVYIEKWVRD